MQLRLQAQEGSAAWPPVLGKTDDLGRGADELAIGLMPVAVEHVRGLRVLDCCRKPLPAFLAGRAQVFARTECHTPLSTSSL